MMQGLQVPFVCGKIREEEGATEMKIDNHDGRLRYYELVLHRTDIRDFPEYFLPEGYSFCFYESEVDVEDWLQIEVSAGEFLTIEEGRESWEEYYGSGEESKAFRGKQLPTVQDELRRRMLFVVNPAGEKVATATAFYEPEDKSGAGWMHWVAVRRDHQGKGLAKPLISRVLQVMRELGYQEVKIPTQTTTWLAVKVYLDFGFRPIPQNATNSYEGYRIVRTLTNHPALSEFSEMPEEEMFDPKMVEIDAFLKERYPDLVGYKVWWKTGIYQVWFLREGQTEAEYLEFGEVE